MKMLRHFVIDICGCKGDWKMDSFVEGTIAQLKEKIGNGKVLCALSGGVDSSVAAVLLSKAVGKQLTCVFVDHGLLRKNEGDEVEAVFAPMAHMNCSLSGSMLNSGITRNWKALPIQSRSGRSLVLNLFGSLKKKPRRLARWTFWCKEPFIRT